MPAQVLAYVNVSELMISLTIVAIGTSLPEVATCVVAVMRGQRELAVGNAVGSNIFNLLLVLGACAVVAPGGGIVVNQTALYRDMPIMFTVALLTLPVFIRRMRSPAGKAGCFLGCMSATPFISSCGLRATRHGLAW